MSEITDSEIVIKKAAMPPTNFVWAILSTIFCCLPLGIISIIYASKVEPLYLQARYDEAREASRKAKLYAKAGAICLLITLIISFICVTISELA